MNFVQGGGCYATGGRCLLGAVGSSAKNSEGGCELHGRFDVWIAQTDDLLISDMGFPPDEPKQCLALGVNRVLASWIASQKSQELRTRVLTTERKCFRCGGVFWMSEHRDFSGLAKTGQAYLCPACIPEEVDDITEKKLGVLRYWCG